MTEQEYENAKKELKEKKWKLRNLTGSDSFTQHMRLHINFLESLISKHEDCYHIGKPAAKHVEFHTEVLK